MLESCFIDNLQCRGLRRGEPEETGIDRIERLRVEPLSRRPRQEARIDHEAAGAPPAPVIFRKCAIVAPTESLAVCAVPR